MDLGKAIGRFKIKFSVLNEIVRKEVDKNVNINLIIDANMMLKGIYREGVQSEVINEKGIKDSASIMVTTILNLISHYKTFFNGISKGLKIYMIFNDKPSKYQKELMKKYGIKYGARMYDKFSSENNEFIIINKIKDNVFDKKGWLRKMGDMIPKFYYMNTGNIDPLFATKYILDNTNNRTFILTQDTDYYQFINEKVSIIHYHSDDKTKLVTTDNIYEELFRDKKYRPIYINYKMFKYILLISGSKNRSIPYLSNKMTMVKTTLFLDKLVSSGVINNNVSFYSMIDTLTDSMILTLDKVNELKDRGFAILPVIVSDISKIIDTDNLDIIMNTDIYNIGYFKNLNEYLPQELKIQYGGLYLE